MVARTATDAPHTFCNYMVGAPNQILCRYCSFISMYLGQFPLDSYVVARNVEKNTPALTNVTSYNSMNIGRVRENYIRISILVSYL